MVGIRGVDDDARDRDAAEVVAGHVRPGVAAVGRLEDAVAEVAVAGQVTLTCTAVDDVVVRGRDGQRPHCERDLVVSQCGPATYACRLVSAPLPDAALGTGEQDGSVLPDRECADSAAHRTEPLVGSRASESLNNRVGTESGPGRVERGRARRRSALPESLRLFLALGAG